MKTEFVGARDQAETASLRAVVRVEEGDLDDIDDVIVELKQDGAVALCTDTASEEHVDTDTNKWELVRVHSFY
eukprot:SAG11_NODE_15713_length_568_cov_1.650320_2_plen_73_part_00